MRPDFNIDWFRLSSEFLRLVPALRLIINVNRRPSRFNLKCRPRRTFSFAFASLRLMQLFKYLLNFLPHRGELKPRRAVRHWYRHPERDRDLDQLSNIGRLY